jgi:hypothetical protein
MHSGVGTTPRPEALAPIPLWEMPVYRSPEANSGRNGQSAETTAGKRRGGLRKLSQTSVSLPQEVRSEGQDRRELRLTWSSTAQQRPAPSLHKIVRPLLGVVGDRAVSSAGGHSYDNGGVQAGGARLSYGMDRQHFVISAPPKRSCPAQGLPPRPAGRGASEAYCGHDRQSRARPARWQRLRAAALQ